MTKQRISAFVLSLLLAVLLTGCQGEGDGDDNGGVDDGEDDGGYHTLVLL